MKNANVLDQYKMNLPFHKLFFVIATVIALFAILILARTILIPLGLALLMSFILYPLVKKLESWGLKNIFSVFLSILLVILLIAVGVLFFSTQIIHLSKDFSEFQEKISILFTDVIVYLNNNVSIIPNLEKGDLLIQMKELLKESAGSLVGETFNSTATILAQFVATIIYTFLILIYRKGFTKAFILFFPEERKEKVFNMFKNIQQVGQQYLSGKIILIIILGFANSVGLLIIGIDNPFLFGYLAAILSIIPYIGTTIGAFIPVLYAFITHDSLWIPFAVAALFWGIQLIETNYLSPKIVGSSMKINALAAILSLIVGAVVWGVVGMILFMPFVAMLKVICEEFDGLKPIALLIGDQNDTGKNVNDMFLSKLTEKTKAWFAKLHKPSKKKEG